MALPGLSACDTVIQVTIPDRDPGLDTLPTVLGRPAQGRYHTVLGVRRRALSSLSTANTRPPTPLRCNETPVNAGRSAA